MHTDAQGRSYAFVEHSGGELVVAAEDGRSIRFKPDKLDCYTNMRKADSEKEGVGRRELLEQDFVIKPKAHNAPWVLF